MNNLGILVIDMQPEFIKTIYFTKEDLLEKQKMLIDFAKEKSIPLFVLEYVDCGETIEILKYSLLEANAIFIDKYNDNGFIIIKNPKEDDEHKYVYSTNHIIIKKYFSDIEFSYEKHVKESKLDSILKKNNIKNLILTGIHKDSCVMETAEEAIKRGYKIITSKEIIDRKKDSTNKWYTKNTIYLDSLDKIFKFVQTPRFINN